MQLGFHMLISVGLGHYTRTLEAKVQRTEGDDGPAVAFVGLSDYAGLLVDVLQNAMVVLKRGLAGFLEEFADVF